MRFTVLASEMTGVLFGLTFVVPTISGGPLMFFIKRDRNFRRRVVSLHNNGESDER
jgi:hypothetical protein